MLKHVAWLALLSVAGAVSTGRSTLFASVPISSSYPECSVEPVAFPEPEVASKNEIFDQLTVAEQLAIEEVMKPLGVSFEPYGKCSSVNCSTIAKIELIYPPKPEVLAYLDGAGPKPKRMASFWWLRGDLRPRVAELREIELPITPTSASVLKRQEPWENRPFVYWDDIAEVLMPDAMAPLDPLFAEILSSIIISDDMKALNPEMYETESEYPKVLYAGNGLSVPGSTGAQRENLGMTMIMSGPEDGWTMGMFKAAPLTYTYLFDYDTEELYVYDLVWCPGLGNPTYGDVASLLAAFNNGTLKMCGVDTEFYGSTKEYMDPGEPFAPADMLARAEPRIYYPDGPRFAVQGRSVSWMGWDFHVDLNGLTGLHVMNLRFQGERIAYEMHATDFTAVYSGASSKKDIFYSDGGYEMGNCATTLKVGLQCPEGSVFLSALGYDSGYIWGDALTEDSTNDKAICIFEAPGNEALFQHAQMRYEGVPRSTLFVRTVLTVGNYDYTQTLTLQMDGAFELWKQLSGYAVGSYVLPDSPNTYELQKLYGSLFSKSSIGSLHTHSAGYKLDLDIAGLPNSFKVKEPKYGPIADTLASAGVDPTGIAYASRNSYYYATEYVSSEGVWDNDGDATFTPPTACLKAVAWKKYIVESDETTNLGNHRSYIISVPTSPPQMLPEGDAYLHLQNFTKCDFSVTVQSPTDMEAVSMSVFGNLYPTPAANGHDISHFFNNESLVDQDLVIYVHSTKPHFVKAEDLPVPSTMGKEIEFMPFNYFKDDISPIKYIPDYKQTVTKCAPPA